MSPDTLHEPEEAHEPPGAVTPKKAALASRRLARQARGERWTRPAGSALRAVRWLRLTGGNIVASKSEAKLFGDVQKHSSTTKSQVKRLVAKARIAHL